MNLFRRIKRFGVGALLAVTVMGAAYGALHWTPDRPLPELASRWATPPSVFVPLDGMAVHVRDEGASTDALPIVLLHGTSSSLHTFDGWAETLSAERRVVRFDLPGFGLTGPQPGGDYSIESYVSFVVGMLDALGIERCVLAGNSLGGHIAWASAVSAPERVAGLVLIDSSGVSVTPRSVPLGFRLARSNLLRPLFENVLPRGVLQSSVENVYGDPGKVSAELVDRYYDLTLREGNRAALGQRMDQYSPDAMSERLADIAQPTLILWGAKDALIPLEAGQTLSETIPDARLVVFDALGHVPQEEAPAETVRPVIEFLAALDGAAAGSRTPSGQAP